MNKKKLTTQFQNKKAKLQSIFTMSDFDTWVGSVIDLTVKYASNLESTIERLKQLPQIPLHIYKSSNLGVKKDDSLLLSNKKDKASQLIDEIIEYVTNNKIKTSARKSFWEDFDVKTLATLWLTTLGILLIAVTAGFYYMYTIGRNSAKDEMQRQANGLNTQIDVLNVKVEELRDSVVLLKKRLDTRRDTQPDYNSDK